MIFRSLILYFVLLVLSGYSFASSNIPYSHHMGFEMDAYFFSVDKKYKMDLGKENTLHESYFHIDRLRLKFTGEKQNTIYNLRLKFDKAPNSDASREQDKIDYAYLEHLSSENLSVTLGKHDSYHAYMSNHVFGELLAGSEEGLGAISKLKGVSVLYSPVESINYIFSLANALEMENGNSNEAPLIGLTGIVQFGAYEAFASFHRDPVSGRKIQSEKTQAVKIVKSTNNDYLSAGIMSINPHSPIRYGIELGYTSRGEIKSTEVQSEMKESQKTTVTDMVFHIDYNFSEEMRGMIELGTSQAQEEGDDGLKNNTTKAALFCQYFPNLVLSYDFGVTFSQSSATASNNEIKSKETSLFAGFGYRGSFQL